MTEKSGLEVSEMYVKIIQLSSKVLIFAPFSRAIIKKWA